MTMNCEQFEQAVLAEPNVTDAARDAHAAECERCMGLLTRVMRLESRLGALMAVPAPASVSADLPDMAALDQREAIEASDNVVSISKPFGRQVPIWLGVAASVALVAMFVLRPQDAAPPVGSGDVLAAAVVEHIAPELNLMRPASQSVSTAKLQSVLAPAGSVLRDEVPLISYAKSCVINGRLVPHLVMQGVDGPVTVLLMPHERVDGPVSIMRDGLEGVILPVGDGGSIAILGRDAASVQSVREQAINAVRFTT